MPAYIEREITEPVKLCTKDGKLNPEAKGWSRRPLHICNLSAPFPRKKKWNFWLILNERFGFSVTVANVDYIGIGNVRIIDFKKKTIVENLTVRPRGVGVDMPDRAEKSVVLKDSSLPISIKHTADSILFESRCSSFQGRKFSAEITLQKPPDHETLNVVIPWNEEEFHFTSKQNTLPASGVVRLGDDVIEFHPEDSFGVLDFGRGIWPKYFEWNWGAFNLRRGNELIGINIGAKWTDGTGANENGICCNGKLYKISEDLIFTYNRDNYLEPWTIKTEISDMMNLTLIPAWDCSGGTDSGPIKAMNHQCFGYFSGTLRAGDKIIDVDKAFGWAEEHIGGW